MNLGSGIYMNIPFTKCAQHRKPNPFIKCSNCTKYIVRVWMHFADRYQVETSTVQSSSRN